MASLEKLCGIKTKIGQVSLQWGSENPLNYFILFTMVLKTLINMPNGMLRKQYSNDLKLNFLLHIFRHLYMY